MVKVLKVLLASAASGVLGILLALAASGLYSRYHYPGDPDPVDFTIGGIFLLTWVGVWFVGTVVTVWLAFRSSRAHAA